MRIAALMTRIGKVVEFIPTAIPWITVVAAPVFEASTMDPTGDLKVAV